jgi:hypothetical protein
MIIKGRSRGGADDLATHLMRVDTNERVEVLEIRGTVAADLRGALREMSAVAAGTRCRKNLYHGSLNVRIQERIDIKQWRFAIDSLETRLGLTGQPRAVVMHAKYGREHVHVVWSRIDAERMCAIPDSKNYRAHEEIAREMERTFGHEFTQGAHVERAGIARPDRTLSHAEQQQADRTQVDVVSLVSEVTELWRAADNGAAFQAALKEKGLTLARGDRRDFVIVDHRGGIHSLARRVDGVRVAQVRERLRDLDLATLPSTKEAKASQARSVALERSPESTGVVQSPWAVFEGLLRTRSYVTEQEMLQALEPYPSPESALNVIREAPDVLALYEPDSDRLAGYTTHAIHAEEVSLLATAKRMATTNRSTFSPAIVAAVCAEHCLDEEQSAAARHALSGAQLTAIIGRAGTGKSHVMNRVIRQVVERCGMEAVFLGPTHAVVQDAVDGGFSRASTVHSLLWYLQHAPDHPNARINRKTFFVLDEAAMVDTKTLSLLTSFAERAGGLLMVGDDKQLASIERGGMFTDLVAEVGAAKLVTVRRQERHWSRRASIAFSEGRFRDGLEAFADRDLLSWSMTLDKSRAALVEQYGLDTVNERGRRFVFSYTNEEVRRLNDAIQALEIERGRVRNVRSFETERGTLQVGEGDRLMFRGTDKPRGIVNGLLATVQTIEGSILVVRTDRGRKISIDLEKFGAVELGYAGTIYRGQGKTLDEAYVLHTRHWRDAASYVALTRSRGATRVFVSRDQARDLEDLARQMSRQSHRGSTLRFSHIPDHRSSGNAPLRNEAGRAMHRDKEREHE